jgi:hypothetical protein
MKAYGGVSDKKKDTLERKINLEWTQKLESQVSVIHLDKKMKNRCIYAL